MLKCLPHEHEEMSLIPRLLHEKLHAVAKWGDGSRWVLGLAGSLVSVASSRPGSDPFQKARWMAAEH